MARLSCAVPQVRPAGEAGAQEQHH